MDYRDNCTYMRTDSPRVASEAINEVRNYIAKNFDKEYRSDEPNAIEIKPNYNKVHYILGYTWHYVSR